MYKKGYLMSKVKIFGDIDKHTKTKLRKSLRRKETAKIKKARLKDNQNTKFYPKTEVDIKRKVRVIIPEHTKQESYVVYCLKQDERGRYYHDPYLRYRTVVVPESSYITTEYLGTKKITPYIKMCDKNDKKFLRKISNRKVRHYKGDLSHKDYKKVFDLWWTFD